MPLLTQGWQAINLDANDSLSIVATDGAARISIASGALAGQTEVIPRGSWSRSYTGPAVLNVQHIAGVVDWNPIYRAELGASNGASVSLPVNPSTAVLWPDASGAWLAPPSGIGGASPVRDSGVSAPASNLTAAAGSAGALTGNYYWGVAFILADGTVTAPWPGTPALVALTAQRANLTSIPVSSSPLVVGRRLYRTPAGPVDVKDLRFLADINDNTTTTFTDNTSDGSLGAPADWMSTANGTVTASNGVTVVRGLGADAVASQALAIGAGTAAGYASVSLGFEAGKATTTGRRNTAVGQYALTALTVGFQNTAIGTHAGNDLTTGGSNVFVGMNAGFRGNTAGSTCNNNTALGYEAINGTASGIGSQNTAVGYRALGSINTADNCIGIGFAAGRYANASRQIFIDNQDRSTIAGCQDQGWLYGEANATVTAQRARFNALVRVGCGDAPVVAGLPAASTALRGFRGYVTDASVAYTSANVGSTVAGGGANVVPVFCNGTAWVIG